MWVNHPLQVSQLGQLSLSSFRVDKLSSELFYGTCAGRASGECSRGLTGAFDQPLCAVCGSNLAVLNLLYVASLRGGCCAVSRSVWLMFVLY